MRRASKIRRAGEWDDGSALDLVRLDADERHRRRIALTGERGTRVLLDLAEAATLHPGDGLVLDDGTIVRVEGRLEPLIEIAAADAPALARLAWHLGNRHTEMQIAGDRLRIRRDHVLEDMLRGLGATLTAIDAAFEPEPGAYGHAHGAHAPGDGHGNGRAQTPAHDRAHDHGHVHSPAADGRHGHD